MNGSLQNKLNEFTKTRNTKKRWLSVVASLCAVVAIGTSAVLINPADTMRQKTYCGFTEHKEHTDECYEKELVCTLSEEGHKHTDGCYEEQSVLVCTLPETEGHIHKDDCYTEERALSCGKAENVSARHDADCYKTELVLVCTDESEDHTHTDECYEEQKTLICDREEHKPHQHDEACFAVRKVLACGEEEAPAHHHDSNCYETQKVLTCTLEEAKSHEHGDECYAPDYEHLICELPIHEHTLQCFSNPNADVETAGVWKATFKDVEFTGNWNEDVLAIADTQIGYTESKANYEVQEDGKTMNGYTRYGDWYGIDYGDWCAMFCSFCMNYAGVDRELIPIAANCQRWIEVLKAPELDLYRPAYNEVLPDGALVYEPTEEEKYVPVPGDLIFFDWEKVDPEHVERRNADHVGFVKELVVDAKTQEIIKVKTVEGNAADAVRVNTYDISDPIIMGYGIMPENPEYGMRTIVSQPASDHAVAVISGMLPENAVAEIVPVPLNEKQLVAYFGEEMAASMTGYVAYDIKIMVDGKEWQPDDSVSVTVKQSELTTAGNEHFGVAHVDGTTNEVSEVNGQINDEGEVTFDADGFSLYIFYTFTVDFHYEGITFSIDGMDSITLADLFAALGIDADVGEVAGVTFSDETLVSVEQNEAGEWVLVSLKAFDTEETLTVTFNDDTVLVIPVTDAQNVTTSAVWNNNGTLTITVDGKSNSGNGKNKPIKLQYSTNSGSSFSNWKETTSNDSKVFSVSGTILDNNVQGSVNAQSLRFRITDDGTAYSTTWTLMDMLGRVSKPSSQNDSFSTWFSSYDGEKTTVADVLTAFGKYQAGESPTGGGGGGGGDDEPDDPLPSGDLPDGITVEWDNSSKIVKLHVDYVTDRRGQKQLQYKNSSGTWVTKYESLSENVYSGDPVTWTWYMVQQNDDPAPSIYGLRVHNYWTGTGGSTVEISCPYVDNTNGTGMYLLMNGIPANVGNFGYTSEVFSQWLTTDYKDNPLYGSPDHLPTTQRELGDAYYWFYNGLDSSGNRLYGEYDPEVTVKSTTASAAGSPTYGDMVAHSVSKRIDKLADNGQSGMDDLYRLYLDFETQVRPVDLLLVVDQSGSMKYTLSGSTSVNDTDNNPDNDSRQSILLRFLDGEVLTRDENGLPTSRAGGFIQNFLGTEENPTGNNLAIVTFGSDSSANDGTDYNGTVRYIRKWDSNARFSGLEEDIKKVTGATNYAAALAAADIIWNYHDAVLNNNHPKLMIFLSDGEPTLAYSDGKMHTGFFDNKKTGGAFVVGNGNSGEKDQLASVFDSFLGKAYTDALMVEAGADPSYANNRWSGGVDSSFLDDHSVANPNSKYWFTESTAAVPSFPLMGDIRDADVSVPGLSSLMGSFVDEDGDPDNKAETFIRWYEASCSDLDNWITGGLVDGKWENSHVDAIDVYDLFELSKGAYKDFQSYNDDVMTYTIGFGSSVSGTYADGVTGKDDVLKYMAGGTDRFRHCSNTATLMDAFDVITKMSGIVMTDVLSDNVTPAASPNLVVTLTRGTADPVTLIDGGSVTTQGQAMLDMSDGATGFATANGKTYLKVVFKDSVIFTEDVKVQAAFTVETTEDAEDAYIDNGYAYPNTGDINRDGQTDKEKYITDYDLQSGHITSSGVKGLYSNLDKVGEVVTGVTWTHMGPQSDAFPRPVVQLSNPPKDPTAPVEDPDYPELDDAVIGSVTKKIDWLGEDANGVAVEGKEDLYRLYLGLEAKTKPVDLLLVVDQSSSMNKTLDGKTPTAGAKSRQTLLTEFLNGTTSNHSDGFIHKFLNSNEDNYLAVLTFGGDCSLDEDSLIKRYVYEWGRENDYVNLPTIPDGSSDAAQSTNYAAAYASADAIWEEHDADTSPLVGNGHLKLMIFLSDGAPTRAYEDGDMHTGWNETVNGTRTVGAGNDGYYATLGASMDGFMNDAAWDNYTIETEHKQLTYNAYRKAGFATVVSDDLGYKDPLGNAWVGTGTTAAPSFPVVTNLLECTVDIPGIDTSESLFGPFSGSAGSNYPYTGGCSTDNLKRYSNFYYRYFNDTTAGNAWFDGGTLGGQIVSPHITVNKTYDIFELTKSAFLEFSKQNADVITYSIGYSSGISAAYPNGRSQNEVLTYMASADRTYMCSDKAALSKAMDTITMIEDVVMTDILSDNVALTDAPNLVITMKQGTAEPVTLMNGGNPTTEGTSLLDMSSGATGFTTVNGKTVLRVKFKEGVVFTDDIKLEAAFTVSTTEAAEDAYVDAGYAYPNTGDYAYKTDTNGDYILVNGEKVLDPITDYDEGHVTSSKEKGLYSNVKTFGDETSGAAWEHLGTQKKQFPMPVVQLAEEPEDPWAPFDPYEGKDPAALATPEIHKTIDYLGDNDNVKDNINPDTTLDSNGVSGLEDAYRLYLDVKDSTVPVNLLLVLDRSNSMYENKDMLIDPKGSATDPNNKQTRMEALLDFLNGSSDSSKDGFIQQFLAANAENRIAAVTFGNDSGADHVTVGTGEDAYQLNDMVIPWCTSYSGELSLPQYKDYGATNYTAAYQTAYDMLEKLKKIDGVPENSRTYVLFLSDGVPTLTYANGMMQNGLSPENTHLFGSGTDGNYESMAQAASYAVMNESYGINDNVYDIIFHKHTFMDHTGDIVQSRHPFGIPTFADFRAAISPQTPPMAGSYPMGYDPFEVTFDFSALGLSVDGNGAMTVTDPTLFNSLSAVCVGIGAEGADEKYAFWELIAEDFVQGKNQAMKDIFALTKSSYDDFRSQIDDDVTVITLGLSADLEKEYVDLLGREREAAEVLKYMALHGGKDGGYIVAPSGQTMAEEVNKLFLIRNPQITDELSSNVDVHDTADLVVYRTSASDDTPEILFKNGEPTTAGTGIIQNAYVNKALRDGKGNITTNGKLVVDFCDGFALDNQYIYSASFNIKVEESTKTAFNGTYPNVGDYVVETDVNGNETLIPITDHTSRITSSGAGGYFSNTTATFTWGDDPLKPVGSRTYPKPVVQVQRFNEIGLKKVDAKDTLIGLAGAEFDLYNEIPEAKTGSIVYTDESGSTHHLLKVNAAPLVSANNAVIQVKDLANGQYYLCETKAPMGYNSLNHPIAFTLSSDGISLPSKEKDAQVKNSEPFVLAVKNTSGYELPETGGPGALLYTVIGLAVMAGALMGACVTSRRRGRKSHNHT